MKFNYSQFEEELEILLAKDIITSWQVFGVGHYRINDEIDVWPKNKKYMFKDTWRSSVYEELEELFH